jgi:hypothetical protein
MRLWRDLELGLGHTLPKPWKLRDLDRAMTQRETAIDGQRLRSRSVARGVGDYLEPRGVLTSVNGAPSHVISFGRDRSEGFWYKRLAQHWLRLSSAAPAFSGQSLRLLRA